MSLPFTPRDVQATETRLERVYAGARLGLKGDKLAVYAGLLPVEFTQLKQLDPVVELAELKGRSDSEAESAQSLRDAALSGDTRAALAILQHRHDWMVKLDRDTGGGAGKGGDISFNIVIGSTHPELEAKNDVKLKVKHEVVEGEFVEEKRIA